MAICIFALVSCGGDKTPDVTEKKGEWVDLSLFDIYFAEGSGAETSEALEELRDAIALAYGVQPRMESDFVLPDEEIPTGTNEILIGNTNRAESAALISDTDSALDFHISYDGTRLCVVGATDEATANGVYYLISLIGEDGLFMDAGYKYDYIHRYACENAKIMGEGIETYTIVYKNSNLAKDLAKDIATVIEKSTGKTLTVAREDKVEEGKHILIGSKEELSADIIPDGHGYGIYADGEILCMSYASGKAAYMLQKQVGELFAADFEIGEGYSDVREAEILKVSLLGDSNTALATIQQWLDVYLTTRYPDMLIELDNRGISGDTANGAYARLDWDLYNYDPDVVIISFGGNGMTEYVGSLTDTPVSETERQLKIQWYMSNMTRLLDDLQAKGKEVIIASSICYDEWLESTTANYKYVYVTYVDITEMLREEANTRGLQFVDIYNNLLPINKDYRESSGNYGTALINNDRKHVNMAGALTAAYAFVEDSDWSSEIVASVALAAESKEAIAESAAVTVMRAESDYIKYTYRPYAIPFTVNEYYKQVAGYGTLDLDAYNKEIIKVSGLTEGEYEIRFDGVTVTTATAAELAEGVNIAARDRNPSQTASRYLFNALNEKRKNIANDRTFKYIEKQYIRKNGLQTDLSIDEQADLYASLVETSAVSGYLKSAMESFISKANDIKNYKTQNDYYDYTALSYAHADEYTVEIVKK